MKGKECVAIAADRRFGVQAQTISTEFDKIFEMGPNLYLGLPGLATDVQTVYECSFMSFFKIYYSSFLVSGEKIIGTVLFCFKVQQKTFYMPVVCLPDFLCQEVVLCSCIFF